MTRTRIKFFKMFWTSEAEEVDVPRRPDPTKDQRPNGTVDPWTDLDLLLISSYVNITFESVPVKVKPVKFI